MSTLIKFADTKIEEIKAAILNEIGIQPDTGSIDAVEAARSVSELQDLCNTDALDPRTLSQTVANTLGFEWQSSISDLHPSADFVKRYPISLARKQLLLGLSKEEGSNVMPVAIGCLDSLEHLDNIRRFFGCAILPLLTTQNSVLSAINLAYESRDSQTTQAIGSLDVDSDWETLEQLSQREDLLDSSGRSPIIRLVNSILFDAVRSRASDIHLQPLENILQVRFRIDGVLFNQFEIPKHSQEEVLSRIKVIGEMNIAEKRLPQDGRASVQIGDRLVDLRIASIPTNFGERIVIRLLDKSARLYTLGELGMPENILGTFRRIIQQEHGLILVTGPTGGGKSTTLYAGLQEINSSERNVVTLEDPIEYQLEGISQTQVSNKKGMTFASGLRSVLRQDPDIIMVGEIRDQETAEMAIQSALTGHMVFSTLHTNDAPSAVNRLLDLGIEPYLVASSLVGVLAQRLVRRICENCKTEVIDNDDNQLPAEGSYSVGKQFVGRGCESCRNTGYQGRLGVFELMPITDSLRSLIQRRMNASDIRIQARIDGMESLRDDGVNKVNAGLTTIDEVIRVSMDSS